MDLSLANVIPCNGPCRKSFSPATVNLDQTIANFLPTSDSRSSGLLWLCPQCRLTVNLHHHRSILPTNVWQMVFRYLDNNSLLRVRTTCRRWRDIVDKNDCLREELRVVFGANIMDEQFEPKNLFPAARALFYHSKIISVDAWWLAFGAALTNLNFYSCKIRLPVLLGMLRNTPNLTSLTLDLIRYSSVKEIDVNFSLERMESLTCDQVFDVFGKLFPRLRKLELEPVPKNAEEEERAYRLMRLVQGTLKDLKIVQTPKMLKRIASMNQLQLTRVDLWGEDYLLPFCKLQPMIKILRVFAGNSELIGIGQKLKNLEEVSVDIADDYADSDEDMSEEYGSDADMSEEYGSDEYEELSFHTEMPRLTRLSLTGMNNAHFKIKCFNGTNQLSYLKLEHLICIDLGKFLSTCRKLQKFEMDGCKVGSWSDIFAARWESLRCLTLRNNSVHQNILKVPHQLTTLKELELIGCNISTKNLGKLILQCPQLQKLTLCFMQAVDDELVCALSRTPQLTRLRIDCCIVTEKSVQFLAESCPRLIVSVTCSQDVDML